MMSGVTAMVNDVDISDGPVGAGVDTESTAQPAYQTNHVPTPHHTIARLIAAPSPADTLRLRDRCTKDPVSRRVSPIGEVDADGGRGHHITSRLVLAVEGHFRQRENGSGSPAACECREGRLILVLHPHQREDG